jgi:phage minor structural protein
MEDVMTPVLFNATYTTYTTNGIGSLAQCTECTVTEERNGTYELELKYPASGVLINLLKVDCIVLAKPNDTAQPQPFRVYRISNPINGILTVYAEHISYRLSAIPVGRFTAVNAADAMAKLKTNAAVTCPFTMWTDKTTVANFSVGQPSSIRALLGGQAGSILDVYGGEFEFDNLTVKLHANRGSDKGVTLRYGKNITDIKQEENIQNLITGVYPFWQKDDTYVELTGKIVTISSGFSYARVVPLDCSDKWEEPPTQTQLQQAATSYLNQPGRGVPKISIDVSFIQLWQTAGNESLGALERVSLCDTVTVVFESLKINATAKVVRTVYDTLHERYKEITLGEARGTLEGALTSQKAELEQEIKRLIDNAVGMDAVNEATQEIINGLNGYVTFNRNGQGKVYEILIMDTESTDTAVKVWRWNSGGLGYSSTGYNGPYGTAITASGKIVADFITTGTLNAALANITNINASNINTGTLAANRIQTNGLIVGGWTIRDSAGLYYGTESTPTHYLGTSGKALAIGGTSRDNIIFKAGSNFGVDSSGTAYIANGVFSGQIAATTGSIGGWSIGGAGLYYGTEAAPTHYLGTSGKTIAIGGTSRNNIIFKAGANFGVASDGTAYISNGVFNGSLSGATGTFSGNLSGAGGTFSGALQAATGTFSGNLSAAGGTFSGDLQAAGGSFRGNLSAATGTFSGNLVAAGGTFSGALQAATGTFSGNLSAAGGTFSGTLQAASGTFTGNLTATTCYFNNLQSNAGGSIRIGGWTFLNDGMEYTNGVFDLEYSGGTAKIAGTAPMSVGPYTNNVMNPLTLYGTQISLIANTTYNNMRLWVPGTIDLSLTPMNSGTCNIGTSSYYFDYVYAAHHNTVSLRATKKNIRALDGTEYDFMSLNPVLYEDAKSDSGTRYLGFIAEEIEEACPSAVSYSKETGELSGLDYSRFVVVLTKELQRLIKRVAALEAQTSKGE